MSLLLDERRICIEFSDLARRRPISRPDEGRERYPGAHQSDILAYCARHAGWLKPNEPLEEEIPERMLQGIMFEELFFSLPFMRRVVWQPGERVVDEIAVNPDGLGELEQDEYEGRGKEVEQYIGAAYLEETKFTEKKLMRGVDFIEDKLYAHQGRAYGHAYGGVELVRYDIWYYRGNYAGSGPVCMQYLVWFSEREREQTWKMLRKNKDAAMREITERNSQVTIPT